MDQITTLLGSATTLFGVVVALAVMVVGFFKGREWMASSMKVDEFNHYRRARSQDGFDGSLSDYRERNAAFERFRKNDEKYM